MFIKPFKVKTNILITGSDKKRLKSRIISQFPDASDAEISEVISKKSTVCAIKATLHNETNVVIYTSDKTPVFFEVQNVLYPTVYTLWTCLDLVPLFTTHPPVLPILGKGADLMIPGIVKKGADLRSWGNYRKDQIVAVNLTSNKAAVGVGTLARCSEDLYMSGGQGVCVKMLHVFGDKLWGLEPAACQQIPLMNAVFAVPKDSDFPPLGTKPPRPKVEKFAKPVKEVVVETPELPVENDVEKNEEVEETGPTPDELLRFAFLNTIKLNAKNITVPILASTFYPQYVITELPEPMDIKKTSFKKVSVFLKKMADEGFIVMKEEQKGIEKIHSLNVEHPEVLSFRPYKKKKEPIESDELAAPLLLTKMIAMYAVNDDTAKFFTAFSVPIGKQLDWFEIKNYVKDYIGRNKLVDPVTKKITLDPILLEICDAKTDNLSIDSLNYSVMSKMTRTYEMKSHKGPVTKLGKKAMIHITTAVRSGNKKVTLISNLEDYGINMPEFSKACKLGAAASTTLTSVPGQKGEQLLVQGNHVKFIYDFLVNTYKIPKSNITGLEFATKEKKKKN